MDKRYAGFCDKDYEVWPSLFGEDYTKTLKQTAGEVNPCKKGQKTFRGGFSRGAYLGARGRWSTWRLHAVPHPSLLPALERTAGCALLPRILPR